MNNPIDRTLSKLPYVRAMFEDEDINKLNKKFDIFSSASITEEKQKQRLSIVNQYDHEMEFATNGGKHIPLYYHQLMNGATSNDKKRRIIEYRSMASYSMVASAIREICNEMFVKDEHGQIVKCKLRGDYNDEVKSIIEDEFQRFLNVFKIDERGWRYIWDHIVEGELFFENIVSLQHPERGILGLTRIAAERIDPLYYDLDNELIDSFILRAKQQDQYPYQWGKSSLGQYNSENQTRLIFLNDKQVTYISNTAWEETAKKYKLPVLAEAHRAYRQLALIEDATIIYMLMRAPQRLVFNVDVGHLPPSKQEQHLQRLMAKFWTKKSMSSNGQVVNEYDAMGMAENYIFAKPREGEGTTVTTLDGGNASPDNLEILNFFVKKLYDALHVPISRLNSDTTFADGENISREELRFANFIMDIQKQWAYAIKSTFITHLKLRGKKLSQLARSLKMGDVEISMKGDTKEKTTVGAVYLKDSTNWDNTCWDNIRQLDTAILTHIDTQLSQATEAYNMISASIHESLDKREALIENIKQLDSQAVDIIDENVENNKLILDFLNRSISDLIAEQNQHAERIDQLSAMKNDSESWWEQYDLKEEDLDVMLNPPTQFYTIRQQQLRIQQTDNYSTMTANDLVSNTLMQKECLGWDDKKVLANRRFLINDAALRWMLANVEANGPDFREKALKEMQGATSGEDVDFGGMGGGGGSLPSGDTNLPEFGAPPGGENAEGAAPEGAAPQAAPADNTQAAPPKAESVIHVKGIPNPWGLTPDNIYTVDINPMVEGLNADMQQLLESTEIDDIYKNSTNARFVHPVLSHK